MAHHFLAANFHGIHQTELEVQDVEPEWEFEQLEHSDRPQLADIGGGGMAGRGKAGQYGRGGMVGRGRGAQYGRGGVVGRGKGAIEGEQLGLNDSRAKFNVQEIANPQASSQRLQPTLLQDLPSAFAGAGAQYAKYCVGPTLLLAYLALMIIMRVRAARVTPPAAIDVEDPCTP